jgi:hypothetical protein
LDINGLGLYIQEPSFAGLLHAFLNHQVGGSDSSDMDVSDEDGDILDHISPISVFHSAISSFYTPSDPSGIHGMHQECIWSTPLWWSSGLWHDCIFVVEDEDKEGFWGMSVVHVKLFFSFAYEGDEYPCALVEWFKKVGRSPDKQIYMWVIKLEEDHHGRHLTSVVHLNTVLWGAHLIPIFGTGFLPHNFHHNWSLNSFKAFFVNKYADHHANEIAF